MITFQYRSTQLPAYRGIQGVPYELIYGAGIVAPSVKPVTTESGVFGGNYLDVINTVINTRGVSYFGRLNFSNNPSFSVLIRVIPRFSGAPGDNFALFSACDGLGLVQRNGIEIFVDSTGLLYLQAYDKNANLVVNLNTPVSLNFVNGQATDIMVAWDGTTNANAVKFSQDGISKGNGNALGVMVSDNTLVRNLILGSSRLHVKSNFDVNECVVWDTAESVVYSPRSDFTTATAFDGNNSTDPGVGNVKSGVGYVISGNTLTGTLVSTDPGIANVKNGVGYTIESVAKTGILVSTDPGQANVLSGVAYTIESVAKTGTLLSTDPGVGNVRRGVSYSINSVAKTGALFSPDLSTQRLLANQPVKIIQGEDVQFIGTVQSKVDGSVLDISQFTEIVAKFLKSDLTSLSLKLSTANIFVNIDNHNEFVIVMSAAQSALLNLSDPAIPGQKLGAMELITTDSVGATTIYDYPKALLVRAPALP